MTTFEYHRAAASEFDAVEAMNDSDVSGASTDDSPHQRSARAARRITTLGEMTESLAHDFRNILTTIESRINLAERYLNDPRKGDASLSAAREGVRRGTRLTSQLLGFVEPE